MQVACAFEVLEDNFVPSFLNNQAKDRFPIGVRGSVLSDDVDEYEYDDDEDEDYEDELDEDSEFDDEEFADDEDDDEQYQDEDEYDDDPNIEDDDL